MGDITHLRGTPGAPCSHQTSTSIVPLPPPPAVLQPQVPPGFCKCSLLSSRDSTCKQSPGCGPPDPHVQGQLALLMGQGAAPSPEGQCGCCLALLPGCLGLGCCPHHLRLLGLCSCSQIPGLDSRQSLRQWCSWQPRSKPFTALQ